MTEKPGDAKKALVATEKWSFPKEWVEKNAEVRFAKAALELQKSSFKDTKGYGYNYQSLDSLLCAGRKIFAGHGLGFRQRFLYRDGKKYVETVLIDFVSQSVLSRSETGVPPGEKHFKGKKEISSIQDFGSNMTYCRRYDLTCLLGIQATEDTDGHKGESR